MYRRSINFTRITTILQKEYKTNEEADFLNNYLSQVDDFMKCTSKISKQEKLQLLRSLSCKIFSSGESVFSPGDPVENFYIVLKGSVDHITAEKGLRMVSTITPGKQIGDKNYMKLSSRTTSCIALTDVVLLDIQIDIFREILGDDAHMLLNKKIKFIDLYFPGIKKYSFSHRERIAHQFEVMVLKKGAVIQQQGESSEKVFFLCHGEIELTSEQIKVPILKLAPGSCISEEVIFGVECKYTSIVSTEIAILYILDKNDVMQFVPDDTKETWKRNYLLKEQERKRLSGNVELRLSYLASTPKRIGFTMASPQAQKHLNFVSLRYNLSSSHKELREGKSFLDSKRILMQLRTSTRINRPVTVRLAAVEI